MRRNTNIMWPLFQVLKPNRRFSQCVQPSPSIRFFGFWDLFYREKERAAMADVTVVVSTDLPVKRPREEEENCVSALTESMDVEANQELNGISTVIPGWFSEISPMWPGEFSFKFLLLFSCFCEIA